MPGPTEPITNRGCCGVDQWSADSRAIRAPACASSSIRSVMSYSARFAQLAPNVFVSTRSTPTSEVRIVNRAHHVRPGHIKDLVAALMPFEIFEGQVVGLQHRAHSAVSNQNAGRESFAQSRTLISHSELKATCNTKRAYACLRCDARSHPKSPAGVT